MFKIGDIVNYHSIIGGEITSKDHAIKVVEMEPNNFGCDVAWITNKSGCVALKALSNNENPLPEKISKKKMKSKARYNRYLEFGDCFDTFLDFCYWDSAPDRNWNWR